MLFVLLLAVGLIGASASVARSGFQNQDESAGDQPEAQSGDNGSQDSKKQADEEPLPKYEDMIENIPTVEQLLTQPPVDWIVLQNDDVIVCEPVTPRPNTLATIDERIAESLKWPRPRTPEEREELAGKREALHHITVILPDGGENPEYQLHIKYVKQILHHEDLLLKRIELLQDEGNLATAFEMLFNLKRRHPGWPGVNETQNRMLLFEAKHRIEQNRPDAALVFLEELHGRDPKYPEVKNQLGVAADRLVSAAVADEDFRRARHFLARLRRLEPEHSITVKWRDELLGRSQKLLDEARAARADGKHDVAARVVRGAALVWPDTPGLRSAHDLMNDRFQTLRVGVQQLPGEKSPYFLPTLADARRKHLTESLLFEPDRIDEVVRYRSRFFEEWEPADLGRRTVFSLVPERPSWQPEPIVDAMQVVETIQARLDPNHPAYDERLDSYLESVTLLSPTEFLARFSRVPPRMESVFRFPVIDDDAGRTAYLSSGPDQAPPLTKGGSGSKLLSPRFQPHDPAEPATGTNVYRRAVPEPDGAGEYHVAEVIETRFDSHQKAIQALFRGSVDLIPHLRPWEVDRLSLDVRFTVHRSALPVMHVLQFNPASEPLRNRELRRALEYALDRDRILRRSVLRDADAAHGRVVSAPFSTGSYAYNPVVEPREYNLPVGIALTLAARIELEKDLPELKMVCAPGPTVKPAAAALVAQWKRIGLDVKLVTGSSGNDSPSGEWDIVYRTYKIADPVVELWPLLTLEDRARVEALTHMPDWLRQELIELDTARDWNAAVGILQDLHEHLAAEAWLIPLWEVDDYLIVSKNVRGVRERPLYPYHDIERWRIIPWYPTQAP